MSFREKRAWASLILLLIWSISYSHLLIGTVNHMAPEQFGQRILLHILLVALIIFVLLEGFLYLILKYFSPDDANSPKDEREILIELKATKVAYTAFIISSIIAAVLVVHHPALGIFSWLTGHIVLVPIVLAQLVKYGVQIFNYRRES